MEYNPPPKPDFPEHEPETANAVQDTQGNAGPGYVYQENKRDFKHSGPGIASFIIAVVTFIGYAISFGYAILQASSILDNSNDLIGESASAIMYLGLSVLLLAAVNVVGAVVGIIGLTLRKRRKVFAILGTIINGVILLLFMLLIATILVNAGA